jgi:hypothetical protein
MLSKLGFERARELFATEFEETGKSAVRSSHNIHPVGLVLNVDLHENRAVVEKKNTFFFSVYPSLFWNRLRRNFWLRYMQSVELAGINDDGGSEKHSRWVENNLYQPLLGDRTKIV